MLADIIAPARLRAGDPQALAALVAVGGWSVVSYCKRAGAGEEVAAAAVLALVTFRRRAIEAGDEGGADLERLLLRSARDAVDEVRGDAPAEDDARAAEAAFARASPRPLSPRLATAMLHALADAAPVEGDRAQVVAAAQRGYADAYAAAEAAPAVAGEQRLGPASTLLLEAADARLPAPAQTAASAEQPALRRPEPPGRAAARGAAPPLAVRLRGLPPAQRAVGFAGAFVVVLLLASLLFGGDGEQAQPQATETARVQTVTVTVGATRTTRTTASPGARSQVVRAAPRTPVTASGGRFEVVPVADAAWAREIRAEEARRGSRWVTIAVRSRNVSRSDLVLRTLNHRLRTERGVVLGPRVLEVADGPARAREGRLARGAAATVRLGFEVPFEAGALSFAFEPGGLDEPTVLVSLGAVDQPG